METTNRDNQRKISMNHAADRARGQGTERERDQETNRETEQKTDPEIGQRTEEPSSVKERLLAAATKEFLERGYEKASLRRICAEAGVTTGALYFWFENKEELLDQVVGGTLEQLGRLSAEMIDAELADASLGVESEKRLLSFFWYHRDVFLILAEKSAGTKYETFMEEAMDQLGEAFLQFFRKYGVEEADRDLVRILIEMKVRGYTQMIMGGYSLERTLELAEQIGWYTDGGFEALMRKLNQKDM